MKSCKWKLLNSGVKSAVSHMETDAQLLNSLEHQNLPILHFYEWERPSATYGYFIKPEKYLNFEGVKKHGLELAKRPTGGGIVFHLSDLAFSVLLPKSHPGFSLNTMNNYAFINKIVSEAIIKFMGKSGPIIGLLPQEPQESVLEASSFCMAKPTKYDVILNGLKVGGGAERLTKFGLLHQGTIALQIPCENILGEVLQSEDVIECMKKNSYCLLKDTDSVSVLNAAKKEMQQLLIDAFSSK